MQVLKSLVSPRNSKFARQKCQIGQLLSSQCNGMREKLQCGEGKSVSCPGERNAADAYERELSKVRKKALNLQILTRDSSRALLDSMSAVDDHRDLQLVGIERKIHEIGGMSLVCAARERLEGYALAEKIAAKLQVWQCGNAAGLRCVESRLAQLECRILERTDTAVEAVRTCRGCVSSRRLLSCLGEASAAADCILELSEQHLKTELASVEQLCAQIRLENARVRSEIANPLKADISSFDRHLEECIEALSSL